MSESGLRQSQQSGFSEQNQQIRFYQEQMQALRFKVSEARIQSEVAQREKAASDARLQEKQSELNILQKKYVREEEQRMNLEDHVALLQQKFNFPSKLPLLRGQALENARAELKQLRQFLHDKDRTIVSLEDQLADLRTSQERNLEPYVRELEALALESQRKEIVLMSLNNQTKELQREVAMSRKEREEGLKRLQNELQRTHHENGELRLMMDEADHQIQKREAQLQTLTEAAKRADSISEQMQEMQHKHQAEVERLERELKEAKEEFTKVKENDYNYERMAEKNARQFDYETGCMRDAFSNKLSKAREEADDLKLQRDRLFEELETLRERNQALSEEVTALTLLQPDEEEEKALKFPAQTQTDPEVQKIEKEPQSPTILEAQFDELVRLLYEEEEEGKDREEWLVRVHEDVKRARDLEEELDRLKKKVSQQARDSNVSSSDFTHKLLIQRDKQIEALKAELARYQELPSQVQEMQRYNEQLALSNHQLQMQITELSQSTLQLQSPNATAGATGLSNFPSLPQMRVLEEVAHSTAGLASALGMDSVSLTALAKEGANHLAVHSLSGTSVKDSRQLQFQQNPEHAYLWGQRMAKELQEVLKSAEKVIKLKTTEASEAKRLLKEAKKAASVKEKRNEVLIQTEVATSELEAMNKTIKEKEREIGNLKAEVARLEELLKEQLGRSRGIYSQRGSPFTTPLTSRLEKQDERLQKALFGSKAEETKEGKKDIEEQEIVPDEYEDAQGTLIPFKTPRTGRQPRATSISKIKEEEAFLQALDYIIGQVQEGKEKIEVEEELDNEIFRRVLSMKKNLEFRVTCAIEDLAEQVRGQRGTEETGKYKTIEGALAELRKALQLLRERLENQMREGELQGKQETLEEVKETAVKIFKLEELASTTNVFTLLQSMKQQIDGEREEIEEQCEVVEKEMQKELEAVRGEYEQKVEQLVDEQEEERKKWKVEKEELRKEIECELQKGWEELKERKNAEINQAVALKQEEMEARMQSEAHKIVASKRAEMEREFEEQRKTLEDRQKERIMELQTREEERIQKLEAHYKDLQEKGRVAEEAREKDREERLQERKNQLERTHQAKLEALKSERETMEQQVRFTLNQGQRDSKDQRDYALKKTQDELSEAKARIAYQEQRLKQLQRSVTTVTKQRDLERNKAQKRSTTTSARMLPTGGSGANTARGSSNGPERTQEMLQMEVIELKEQLEKEKKKAKEDLKTAAEKHRADLRRVQTEKENVTKRVESACELKVKKMQQELQDKTVELEMQRESGEREVEREIGRMKKEYSTREAECQQKEKLTREQTEKQINKMKRELREQLITHEQELRDQMKQEYSAITAESECKLREVKEQLAELQKENHLLRAKAEIQSQKEEEPLDAYLRVDGTQGDSVVIPNERSLYDSQKHEEGIKAAQQEKSNKKRGDESERTQEDARLKSLQQRMNAMMQKMQETVQRRCEQNKREERQRSLEKMKKARVYIVEDAFEKFAELLGVVLERLNQQMRTSPNTQPPSPNRSLLDDSKYEQKIEVQLKSLGLTVGQKRPSIGELAVRQVEQKVTSLLLSAKELLTLQFQEEKDVLYEQVAGLEREIAEAQDALQNSEKKERMSGIKRREDLGEENREKKEDEVIEEIQQVKQGTSAIKVLKDFQSPSDTLEGKVLSVSKGAGLQERDLASEENYPVNLRPPQKEREEAIQDKQFMKDLVSDLLLMADTFTQILVEPDNAASLREVAVWLKKETKKLRKRTMSAKSKYYSVFNLLAKSVLEIKRALVSASKEIVHGPRRQQIVRLRMQNLDLHQKVGQLQSQIRDILKREREAPPSSASVCKFEQSMSESGMGASTMTRLLHNPELLSPDQTLSLLKNVIAQAKSDESVFNLLKQSPQFSLFLEQLKLDLPIHKAEPELGCSDQTLKHEVEFRHSIPEEEEQESGDLYYSEGAGTSRFGDAFESSIGTALGAGAALARQVHHQRIDSISQIQHSVNQIYSAMAAKRSSFS